MGNSRKKASLPIPKKNVAPNIAVNRDSPTAACLSTLR